MKSDIKLYLRPLILADAEEKYLSWLNDPIVTEHLETKSSTLEQLKEYVRFHLEKSDCKLLGIFDASNEELIGTVKFDQIDHKKGDAQFAMMIGDRSYWGKGLGTYSTRLAVEYAFEELNLTRINLGVIAANEPAIRAYHRVGFKDIAHDRVVVRADKSKHPAIDMTLCREEYDSKSA